MCGSPSTNREPYQRELYASAARTATPTAVTFYNEGNFNALQIFVSATASSSTPSVVVTIDTWNSKADKWVTLLTGAAITGVSENIYQVGGAGQNVSNLVDVRHPGKRIRVTLTHGDSDSITYSVAASFLRS